jgi:pyruvate-ferredoxin/flavodoxin oxidoreductase
VDQALAHIHEGKVPDKVNATFDMLPAVSPQAPQFVRNVLGTTITGNADALPVSAMPIDGTFPTGTAMWAA